MKRVGLRWGAPVKTSVVGWLLAGVLGCGGTAPPSTAAETPSESAWFAEDAKVHPDLLPVAYKEAPPIRLTTSDGMDLELSSLDTKTVVDGPIAFTEIHMRFKNTEDRVREGRFRMSVPEGAGVTRLAMRIGEKWQEGEFLPKQQARRTYEDFLHRRQDPALLEQGAANEIAARVFPIPANSEKEIVVAYSQLRESDDQVLAPLRGLPSMAQVSATISEVGATKPAVQWTRADYRPTHDLVAPASTTNGVAGSRAGDKVVTWIDAPVSSDPAPVESLAILVDTSASRALDLPHAVTQLSATLANLQQEHGDFPVTLMAFDQTSDVLYRGPVSRIRDGALASITQRAALGASDIEGALTSMRLELKQHPRKRLLVVSDGVPTAGAQEAAGLQRSAQKLADQGVVRIDAMVFGGLRDSDNLRALTTSNLPKHGVVLDGATPSTTIAKRIGHSTMSGLRLSVDGATWSWPRQLDGVQGGDRVAVVATVPAAERDVVVRINGQSSQPLKLHTGDARLVEHAWAAARIRALSTDAMVSDAAATTEEITKLSVQHRVLSPHTALLVLETENDYRRYGIDRTDLGTILAVNQAGHGLTTVKRNLQNVDSKEKRQTPTDADPRFANSGDISSQLSQLDVRTLGAKGPVGSASSFGESFGAGGLGLSGIGEGGGGTGEAIGLGSIGTVGHGAGTGTGQGFGSGSGRIGGAAVSGGAVAGSSGAVVGSHRTRPPLIRMGATQVSGRLPPEVIQRIVRMNRGRMRACYEQVLRTDPTAAGRVALQFRIDPAGSVKGSTVASSDIDSAEFRSCLTAAMDQLAFPPPTGGTVTVMYPFVFAPEDDGSNSNGSAVALAPNRSRIPVPANEPPEPDPKPECHPYDGPFAEIMGHLKRDENDAALQKASAWRAQDPGNVLALVALGESLEARGATKLAARAYGSIIDYYPDRADLRRFAGARLERTASFALAQDTYERARSDRPDHPSGYRLSAYTFARTADFEAAFDHLEEAFEQSARWGNYPGVRQLLREDLGIIGAAWLHKQPGSREDIERRLRKVDGKLATEPSLRLVLNWETDANDVDLHVFDDAGGHAYYSDQDLPSGGRLLADVTRGYGPEGFVVPLEKAKTAHEYHVFAHYYAKGPMGYGMGKLAIVHHDGNGGLTFEDRPFVVMKDDAYIDLGHVRVADLSRQ